MGNSQTKESRTHSSSNSRHDSGDQSPTPGRDSGNAPEASSARPSRPRRGSRPDFTSFLGIGGSNENDTMTLEQRREAKLEREARRADKEKQTRLKERERSMREEHVDGGYLVTQGVYVGPEDYSKLTVRQLMIERRLAPFWRGLNDYSESWAEHQLMAAARGMPIPPADHVPPELEYLLTKKATPENNRDKDKVKGMTIPMGSRTQSTQSEQSAQLSPGNSSLPASSMLQPGSPSSSGPLFRARARTLAGLTSSKNNDQREITPREFQLPPDNFVNGQPIEVYLYKDASECPICFLYYPPYLNTTRCCEQAICSECFVQIKRPDPHPPEHEHPDPNAPPMSEEDRLAQAEGLLVSEVAACPYCKQPEFGITYASPPFRRGLTYGAGSQPYQVMSAMSSQTSISSGQMSPGPGSRRRGTSLSATAPEVVTTDKVRPDWANKLAAARAHAARRSAAATALHAAAYLMNSPNERSAFPAFARRNVLRRSTLDGDERALQAHRELEALREAGIFLPTGHLGGSRRNRVDDLEEMMISEAIRLSIAAEEERARKEEKEAKKKAKKEEKESRKAEKAARKNNSLATSPELGFNENTNPMSRSRSNTSSLSPDDVPDKGKGIEREPSQAEGTLPIADHSSSLLSPDAALSSGDLDSSSGIAIPSASEPFRRSHLRQMSNASSASSSYVEAGTNFPGSSTPTGGAGLEPMFNFRSLTAMINEDEKADGSAHVEDSAGRTASYENAENRPSSASQCSSKNEVEAAHGPSLLGKEVDVVIERASDKNERQKQSAS